MTERLITKLDRLGAEAGIKEMTPEIYRFAQLLNEHKLKQWDAWRAKREWVDLTDEEIKTIEEMALTKRMAIEMAIAIVKEKNT